MNIEGLNTFKNFKDYFDDVKNKLTETHINIMEKLNENKGDNVRPPITPPDNSSNFANL